MVEEEATAGGRIFVGMDVLCAGEGGKGALRALRPWRALWELGGFQGWQADLASSTMQKAQLGPARVMLHASRVSFWSSAPSVSTRSTPTE